MLTCYQNGAIFKLFQNGNKKGGWLHAILAIQKKKRKPYDSRGYG